MDHVAALNEAFRARRGVVVGLSGGVDSAVLAKIAHQALGERAVAVIVDSESYAAEERESAIALAIEQHIPHEVVWHSELADANYAANPTNRCFFCRQGLSDVLFGVARARGFDTVAVGTHADDAKEWRPGDAALQERGAWRPFVELGMTKSDVREAARALGLSVSEKPGMACLSSRIPYGEPVTMEKLTRIGRAEAWLRTLGFEQVRVRTLGDGSTARIEVDDPTRALRLVGEIRRALVPMGYRIIDIDPRGYRMGAMNELAGLTSRAP